MAKKDIKFTLDTIDSRYSPVGTVKQLDSVFFYIKITENGVTKDLTGQTIKLFAIKEDKKIVEQTTKINITNQREGLVEIELLNAAIQVHGFTYFELEISDPNGIISTSDFILRVNKRVGSDEAIESTNEVATLKKIEEYVAQAKVELQNFKKLQTSMLETNETINNQEMLRVDGERKRVEAEIIREEKIKQFDSKFALIENKINNFKNNEIKTLFIENAVSFYWVFGCNEVPIFLANNERFIEEGTNNNAYFKITGTKGATTVTVKAGGNATMEDIEGVINWGGVIGYDDGSYKPTLVLSSDKSENIIEVYPALEKDIVNGELGNIAVDGMHLSRRGYIAYMQHAYNSNPKYCEKDKYISKFKPSFSIDEPIPFKKISNSGRLAMGINRVNNTTPFRRNYSTNTFSIFNPWDTLLEQKSGVEWEVNVEGYKGYFETFISGGIYTTNLFKDKGFEMYIEWYLDNKLIKQIIKNTNEIERFCFDFENSKTAKIIIYYNKVRNGDFGETVVIGDSTFWINDYNYGDKLIPKFSNVSQLFDSWGVFHNGASAKEFSRLINADAGVTVPYSNTSKGSQTSAWGKSWWYENVKSKNPSIMITDFAINDGNSTSTDNFPATVTGSDGLEYNNLITEDLYIKNMNDIFTMCKVNGIQPIMFCGCMGTYNNGDWALKLTEGRKVEEEIKPLPPVIDIKPIEIKNTFVATSNGLDNDFTEFGWGDNSGNSFKYSVNNNQSVNINRSSNGGKKLQYNIKSRLENNKKYFIIADMKSSKDLEGMTNVTGNYKQLSKENSVIYGSSISNGSAGNLLLTISLNDGEFGTFNYTVDCIRIFNLTELENTITGISLKTDIEIYKILKDKF